MQNNNRKDRKAWHLIIVNDMLSKADTLLLVQKTKAEAMTRGADGETLPTTSTERDRFSETNDNKKMFW